MKKIQYLALLMLSLFTLTLTGCSSDDDDNVSPQESMLTASEWKGDKIYVNNFDLMLLLEQFGYGDIAAGFDITTWKLKFDRNKSYTATIDGDTGNGTWSFTDNERKIILKDADNEEVTATINRLTDSELYLEVNPRDLGYDFEDDEDLAGIPPITAVELRLKK